MAFHIIQFGEHKFVTGLFWQSLSRPRELAAEAAELAAQIGFDALVVRKEYATAQAGFAQRVDGERSPLYSLAAAVSHTMAQQGVQYDGESQQAHNWLGAFSLPDGKWAYFAMRDANFLPNGDFAGSKDEVLERLRADYAMGGWDLVLGDAGLEQHGFHNFTPRPIDELLPRARDGKIKVSKEWALRGLKKGMPDRRQMLAVVAAAALLAVAVAGLLLWQRHQAQLRAAALEREEQALALARQQMLANAPQQQALHPWLAQPLPSALAKACLAAFAQLTPGGWHLHEYVCTPKAAHYTWARQDSTVALLLAQVPAAVVDLGGDSASLVLPLGLDAGGDEALLPQDQLMPALLSNLQIKGLRLALTRLAIGAPAQGAGAPDWTTYKYSLTSPHWSPLVVASWLSQPGVRLEKIAYRDSAWAIEGVIYVK